jgi:iron complex outermembrane receptor protein
VVEPGLTRNEVANEALDFGASAGRRWIYGPRVVSRIGFDYSGRRAVDAIEVDHDLARPQTPPARRATLENGEQDEAGLYGALEWSMARATLLGGARFSWQRQANGGRAGVEDTAWNGFLGAVVPLAPSLEATANVGTGQRFPSLSERFFSGTTGRGGVVGNPDLASERSLDGDVGLRWYGDRLYLAGYLFRNRIEDYIERVEIAPDLFTYANLISGTLAGAELEGLVRLTGRWQLSWGAHLVEGEDDDGAPLADVPPARLELEASFEEGPWRAAAEWERRFDKDDPGSGEKAIPAAELVGLSLAYRLASGLELTVTAGNLLDELYFGSADEKVPHAPGRSIGVGMTWAPPKGS